MEPCCVCGKEIKTPGPFVKSGKMTYHSDCYFDISKRVGNLEAKVAIQSERSSETVDLLTQIAVPFTYHPRVRCRVCGGIFHFRNSAEKGPVIDDSLE